MTSASLSALDLALASLLVLANALLSVVTSMGVARTFLVAGARLVVQLLLVGLVLKTVFTLQSPWLVGLVIAIMLGAASHEIVLRQERKLAGLWRYGLGSSVTVLATLFVTAFALMIVQPKPWFSPQVTIPLLGIILGSVMNSVSISLNQFNVAVARDRSSIEAQLALGAGRHAALKSLQRSALRSGLIPVINQMSAAGIITLPGMMTGQILAGMAPFEAAKYQILVLLLLSGGAGLGAFGAVALAVWRITDDRDRLRLDRLGSPST